MTRALSIVSSRCESTLQFFALVFALYVPLGLIGAITGAQLVPGLPLGALQAFCQIVAAVILTHRERGAAGTRVLLARLFDYRRSSGSDGTCGS